MTITREEQLEAVRNEWSVALGGAIDIYDWMARALPFIDGHVDRFRFTEAVREIAARGRASPLHKERVALIRSLLATASAAEFPSEAMIPTVTEHKIKNSSPLPAERDIPKVLAKEHGLLWLVMHCHWLARIKVFLSLFLVFGFGVQAAQSQDFMKVWTWMFTPITQIMKLLIK